MGVDDYTIPQKSKTVNSFTFSKISISLVLSHLNSLNPAKSIGPDALPARFLKEISDEIAAPLTDIFNHSLSSGVFPSEWKHSVIPLHKGGSRDDPGTFRPLYN